MARLRVGIIGTGFGTVVQAPGFMLHPDWEVAALSGVSRPGRAQEQATALGIPAAYDNYLDMLDHERLDLVSVVSSPDKHLPMTLAALERGIPVLCEKPMAMNLAEARAMVQGAEQRHLLGIIDHEFRYIPARAQFKRLVAAGYLGDLLHFTMTYSMSGGARHASRPMNWLWQAQSGGGMLGAIGSHMIDQVRWCLGEFRSVLGMLATHVNTRSGEPVTADDGFTFLARMDGNATGVVQFITAAHHSFGLRLEAFGTGGTVVLHDQALYAGKAGEPLAEVPVPARFTVPGVTFPDPVDARTPPFTVMAHNLALALRGGGLASPVPDVATFRDGAAVQAILDAVRRSHAEDRWVDVQGV